jgi:hypothetical protein
MSLTQAVNLTRTGDIWLFRGHSGADRAIQTLTNSPVNHVGMAVVLDDLPPLMWHAELGRSLTDVWAGQHRRGAQLHDLSDAVQVWANRYGQRAWLRQLEPEVSRAAEDAVLRTIARMDGTPFPSSLGLATRWVTSKRPGGRLLARIRRARDDAAEAAEAEPVPTVAEEGLETAYCAEIVAMTYQAMGLLPADRAPGWYDPGRFWSGDRLALQANGKLGAEIEVNVPAAARPSPPSEPPRATRVPHES